MSEVIWLFIGVALGATIAWVTAWTNRERYDFAEIDTDLKNYDLDD